MGMNDIKFSLRMRDAIASIATRVVEELRPEERIGKVFSYNSSSQTCQVLFPKETVSSLVEVHCALNMIPNQMMYTNWNTQGYAAAGNLVRVAGKPGSYYIADFVTGAPADWLGDSRVGFIEMYGGDVEPPNYLFCRGGTFPGSQYPLLASIVGNNFGTKSGDNYYLPDYRSRSPMGRGTLDFNPNFNISYVGMKWGHWQLQSHYHPGLTGYETANHQHDGQVFPSGWEAGGYGLAPGSQGFADRAIVSGSGWMNTLSQSTPHQHYFNTDYVGGGNMENVHPVMGTNFIIRAR